MNQENENDYSGLEIAVIGMAGRFPLAADIDEFWEHLVNGNECISFFSDQELEEVGIREEYRMHPAFVGAYGWLDSIDLFDASFFGYSPLEAEIMDPQMRIFHECVWEALEDAGYDPHTCKKLIGLYAGASANFYWQARVEMSGKGEILGPFTSKQFNDKDFMCARIAHKLNLRGPAIILDTACSSSLVAVHLACQGLLSGDCDIALAGGVSVGLLEKGGYLYQEGMNRSPDGHCRAFDAGAQGSNFGNAVGAVVLKRLEDAAADGDTVHAVIKGSSINNDGIRKAAFSAPSVEGQAGVIRTAQRIAGVKPESICYIEAHGTGTTLGDPVEIEGLKAAFNTHDKHFCRIGSVKTNVGHLETASGIASFIKTVLALKYRLIPPTLFYNTPNPRIDFENSPFIVNTVLTQMERGKYPLRASVNSFAIGGTNAHVILEEWAGSAVPTVQHAGEDSRGYHLILLSAKTETALEKMTRNLADCLENNQNNPASGSNIADAAFTLQVGRGIYKYRQMFVCASVNEAVELLSDPDANPGKVFTRCAEEDRPPVLFRFPDMPPGTIANPGRGLYQGELLFREGIDRCLDLLHPLKRESRSYKTYFSFEENPRLEFFIVQYALADLLIRCGITPIKAVGYGIGEYAAACVSGELTLRDALKRLADPGSIHDASPYYINNKKEESWEQGAFIVEIGPALFNHRALLEQIGKLWLFGHPVDWNLFHAEERKEGSLKRVSLPSYPFERRRYWIENADKNADKKIEPVLSRYETGNGTLQPRPPLKNPYIPPRNDIERSLVKTWQTLFGFDRLGIRDDFIQLGGDSLKAAVMINRVRSRMRTAVPLAKFFEEPTIEKLAAYISNAGKESAAAIPRIEKREYYPISFIQERIFVLDSMSETSTAYNNNFALIVEGDIRRDRMKDTLAVLTRRHESLRTSFDLVDEKPVQIVHDIVDFDIEYIETFTGAPETMIRDFIKPFDLKIAPLMRMAFVKLEPKKHLLLIDMHHIVTDGTSFAVLVSDFVSIYDGKELPPLEIQYKDFSHWQRHGEGRSEIEKQERYWLRRFENGVPRLALKTDFPRPAVQSFDGEHVLFFLEGSVRESLHRLIKETGTTLYMMMLAVCSVLLYKYTDWEDIVIGSPVAAREKEELENLVGMFLNVLVMRSFPRAGLSFSRFLSEVKTSTLEAFENQGYPFGRLLEKTGVSREINRNPLYDFELIVQNIEEPELKTGDLRFVPYKFDPGSAQLDIILEVRDLRDRIALKFMYCTALFKRETIEQMISHFREIVAAVTLDPETRLGDIRLSHDLTVAVSLLPGNETGDFGF
jgi:3-oxoacyl-(acyl-carrier-protein) synthase/acyl carrier protein